MAALPPDQGRAGEAGDAAAARDGFAALLRVLEKVSGAEHPETLTDRANLAYWTRQADRACDSRPAAHSDQLLTLSNHG